MDVIYKSVIEKSWGVSGEKFDLYIPRDAEVLTIQMQRGRPTIWWRQETIHTAVKRTFVVYGTGQQMIISQREGSDYLDDEVDLKYIATVQDGPYVWHFFEEI